jgi:hypothetical protein
MSTPLGAGEYTYFGRYKELQKLKQVLQSMSVSLNPYKIRSLRENPDKIVKVAGS